jgi:pimeloyl-ACP methyl ester carboxylesterase
MSTAPAVSPRLSIGLQPLIVWGTGDIFFHVKWSHWLSRTIPGARRRVEFDGARLFFPEERAQELNDELRLHWQ